MGSGADSGSTVQFVHLTHGVIDNSAPLTILLSLSLPPLFFRQSSISSLRSRGESLISSLNEVAAQKEREVEDTRRTVEMANTSQHAQIMMGIEAEKEVSEDGEWTLKIY